MIPKSGNRFSDHAQTKSLTMTPIQRAGSAGADVDLANPDISDQRIIRRRCRALIECERRDSVALRLQRRGDRSMRLSCAKVSILAGVPNAPSLGAPAHPGSTARLMPIAPMTGARMDDLPCRAGRDRACR